MHIQPRVPRPLTEAEQKKVRARFGGDASPDQLASLAERFAKPDHHRSKESTETKHGRNGWL